MPWKKVASASEGLKMPHTCKLTRRTFHSFKSVLVELDTLEGFIQWINSALQMSRICLCLVLDCLPIRKSYVTTVGTFLWPYRGELTIMLVVANLANTNWCKQPEKWLKPCHLGTHLRVLGEGYLMNTNMTGLSWFSKIFAFFCFGRK